MLEQFREAEETAEEKAAAKKEAMARRLLKGCEQRLGAIAFSAWQYEWLRLSNRPPPRSGLYAPSLDAFFPDECSQKSRWASAPWLPSMASDGHRWLLMAVGIPETSPSCLYTPLRWRHAAVGCICCRSAHTVDQARQRERGRLEHQLRAAEEKSAALASSRDKQIGQLSTQVEGRRAPPECRRGLSGCR